MLNLLRLAWLNPMLSAHASIYGQFNYADTPLDPPGTQVIAYLNPAQRKIWSPRGEEAW